MRSAFKLRLCLLVIASTAFGCSALFAATVTSVQRGSLNWAGATLQGAGYYEKTVALGTAVNAGRSYLIGSMRTTADSGSERTSMELNGAGTQIIFRSFSNNANIDVEWEVVEFSDATVRRGVASFASGTGTVNVGIPAVALNKSFILISERSTEGTSSKDENWTCRARFTSTTNVELQRLGTGATLDVPWQVVEFNDTTTTIQSGLTTIANNATFANATLSPAIALSRSFLLYTRQSDGNNKGKERNYMLGGSFTSTTNLRFDREDKEGPVNISWWVVQLGTDSAVDSGPVSLPVGTTLQDISIAAVDPTKTMTIVTKYGGGADVNKLKSDSITSQLTSATNLRIQRSASESAAAGTWYVVQYKYIAANRETADLDGNGKIDAIRFLAFEPVNDNFTGLTIAVTGYTVSGPITTGSVANDNEFFVPVAEQPLPAYTGDTNATPETQVVANTTLRGTVSNALVRTEPGTAPAEDKAKPVLLKAEWINLGSADGVDAGDEIELTFSEPVTTNNVVLSGTALASDLELPVSNDSWDTSTLANQGPTALVVISLAGAPRISPGGTYSPAAVTAGSPSGIYVRVGTRILDEATVPNSALVKAPATAIDILPGGPAVVAVAWSDHSIAPLIWDLAEQDVGMTFTAATSVPPLILGVVNAGNIRSKFDALVSPSAPSGWTAAATAGSDQFEMKLDASTPLDGVFELDLGTGTKTFATAVYSGFPQPFDLQFATPADVTTGAGVSQSIAVTIVVSQD